MLCFIDQVEELVGLAWFGVELPPQCPAVMHAHAPSLPVPLGVEENHPAGATFHIELLDAVDQNILLDF